MIKMSKKIVTTNNEFNQYVLKYTDEYCTDRNLSYGEFRLIDFFESEYLTIKDGEKYESLYDWCSHNERVIEKAFYNYNASLQDKLIIKDYLNTIFSLLFNEIELQIRG